MLWKAVRRVLRKNQVAVHLDVKDTVTAFDEFRFSAECFFYGGRQTGGLGQIVSFYTVGYGNLHYFLL